MSSAPFEKNVAPHLHSLTTPPLPIPYCNEKKKLLINQA